VTPRQRTTLPTWSICSAITCKENSSLAAPRFGTYSDEDQKLVTHLTYDSSRYKRQCHPQPLQIPKAGVTGIAAGVAEGAGVTPTVAAATAATEGASTR